MNASIHNLGNITIAGTDAAEFLQGQLTCDVKAMEQDSDQLGSYCDVKGRVLTIFMLSLRENAFYLTMPNELLDSIKEILKKYAAFSKVEIQINADQTPLTENPFQLEKGITRIYKETMGKFTPHVLNLDKLGAINFEKGCFLGQEIIARTHYRGAVKQHLYPYQLDGEQSPEIGMPIIINEEQVGTIVDIDSQTKQCLAVLKDSYAAGL